MEIPMMVFAPTINFTEFMHLLREKYKFDYRDMAGRYVWQNAVIDEFKEKYGDAFIKAYATKPDDYTANERIIIDEYYVQIKEQPEYLDAWHYLLDNDFDDFQKGTVRYLDLNNIDNHPEWVRPFYKYVLAEVKNNPAYKDGLVRFFIDW